MRILSLCAILLLLSFIASAQPSDALALEDPKFDQEFSKRVTPTVTGRLINISEEDRKKTKIKYSVVTLLGQSSRTADIMTDGSFRLLLDYPLPYQQIWFDVEDVFYAALYANKDLHVEIDVAKIKASGKDLNFNGEGVRFSGTDGALTDYMNNFILFKRADQLKLSSRVTEIPRLKNPTANEVLTAFGNIYDSIKLIQEEYIKANPSPFAWMLENERQSEFYNHVIVAYWGHKMENDLFEKITKHKTYLITNSSQMFYSYLSTYLMFRGNVSLKFTWQELSKLPDLTREEKSPLDSIRLTEKINSTDSVYLKQQATLWRPLHARTSRMMMTERIQSNNRFADSTFTSSRADIIKLLFQNSKDLKDEELRLSLIQPTIKTEWCRFIAQMEFARATAKLSSVNKALSNSGKATTTSFGKPMLQTGFGASMYKVENTSVDDFLSKLRKSFPGKAIVLDRWATWCGPCLGEMPHSKKLQLDSKDLPVLFVYACTSSGSDESKWKTKVAELELPGIHFFIDPALDAELSQYFSFSGYPGYALIDKKGKYKPGAFKWISEVQDRAALAALIE